MELSGVTERSQSQGARGAFHCGIGVIFLLAAANLMGLPGGASVGHVAMLLCLPLWANAVLARNTPVFVTPAKAAVALILTISAALIIWALISTANAVEPLRVGRVLLSLLGAFAIFSFVAGTITNERLIVVVLAIALAIGAVSALSILGYVNGTIGEIIFGTSDRASGTFKNPNQYGIVLSTTIPITAALVFSSTGRIRLIATGCLLLMAVGLLLSGSKTNLLLTAMSLSALLVLATIVTFSGQKRVVLLILATFGAIALVLVGFQALQYLNPRAVRLILAFAGDGAVPSVLSRQELWAQSIEIFNAHPFLGEGAGQKLLINIDGEQISHSHNILLEYARTLGVPGLVGMIIICLTVFGFASGTILTIVALRPGDAKTRVLTIGAAISSMAYLTANFTSESFGPATSVFFWLNLALFFTFHGQLFPGARSFVHGYRGVHV